MSGQPPGQLEGCLERWIEAGLVSVDAGEDPEDAVEDPEALLERVADLFFLTVDQQSAEDRSAFGDIMERMAIDADTLTRARFSERMSKAEFAPTDLIRGLARDEICVSRPVLQYSPFLCEGDLGEGSRLDITPTVYQREAPLALRFVSRDP